MHADLLQYLPRVLMIAKRAGDEILKIYNGTINVTMKDDRSPLTEADKAAHQVIAKGLATIAFYTAPDGSAAYLPVLSEEGKSIPYAERRTWEYFWLIDPLDGTKEFIKKNGEFTVNIALIHRGRPVLGVIYVPVTGAYYFAASESGSFTMQNGDVLSDPKNASDVSLQTIMLHSRKLPLSVPGADGSEPRKLVIAGSRSHATPELETFVNDMKNKYGEVEFIPAGSSLKFCLVAEGRADIYPRLGPTMEWDTAAGQVIAEEAGGSVQRIDTSESLSYNKEDLLNPWFMVQGFSLNGQNSFMQKA